MSNLKDVTGMKFNNLLVVQRVENSEKGKSRWRCLCDCGNYTIVTGSNLRNGSVKSCGCLLKKNIPRTHGLSKTRLYNEWSGMVQRCENPNSKSYKDYGQKGIKVCIEWRKDFKSFYDWSLLNGYKEGLTIDRINFDEDYCPDNCRWITKGEQAKNRSMNLSIEYLGKTQNLQDWCIELNVDYKRVHNRINKLGWDFERAINTPVQKTKRNRKTRKKYGNN